MNDHLEGLMFEELKHHSASKGKQFTGLVSPDGHRASSIDFEFILSVQLINRLTTGSS